MSAGDDKAKRYIASLDSARANANWNDVPELIRKVSKHASQRKCLIHTATIESELVKILSSVKNINRVDTEPPIPPAQLSELKSDLSDAQFEEDKIQAKSCLLWVHWITQRNEEFSTGLVSSDEINNTSFGASIWTKICLVKGIYIQAILQSQAGQVSRSKATLQSGVSWINSNREQVLSSPQLLYWSRQLLAQSALNLDKETPNFDGQNVPNREALSAFRQWAILSSKDKDVPSTKYGNMATPVSSRSIWKAYYDHLSTLIQVDDDQPPDVAQFSQRDLAIEIRQVETSYENELLRNTRFPHATESNVEVENWVERVVRNWEILCGPRFSETDLGEGGRNAIGRNVIDILYRAAMKTFHSTLILRRLFQVHKSLADFDLAYNALDTYIELIQRGIARASKSNELPKGQDDNETVTRCISEGIEGLCSFGRQKEAEKAYDLTLRLEGFLKEIDSRYAVSSNDRETNLRKDIGSNRGHEITSKTRSFVHRALGIGKAHWARWTPFNEKRSSLQSDAINHLKLSLSQSTQAESQLESLYALSILLAEINEIEESIEYVKRALSLEVPTTDNHSSQTIKKKLIPFWHLLALLLSSRQDFETAWQSCIAAFDQFSSPSVLFGKSAEESDQKQKRGQTQYDGLVDDMESIELQRVIEIRITELALTEVAEGPEHAVNSSNDLLRLYSRLFSRSGLSAEDKPVPKNVEPPKSSAGTVKSFRGSLFGRKKAARSNQLQTDNVNGKASSSPKSSARINGRNPTTPAIQVRDEENKIVPHKHRLFHHSHDTKNVEKHDPTTKATSASHLAKLRDQEKSERPISYASSQRQSFETTHETHEKPETAHSSTGSAETAQPHLDTDIKSPPSAAEVLDANLNDEHNESPQAKQQIKRIPHSLESENNIPLPGDHEKQSTQQDVRLPTVNRTTNATSPSQNPRFPKIATQKHALSILVKIWLVIAVLYRRANMLDDSREACDEAAKAAMKIEALVAGVESSARSFADPGWGGGGKSSDQIWADVHCERAELLIHTAQLKREELKKPDPEGNTDVDTKNGDNDDEDEEDEDQLDHESIRQAVEHYEQCLMYFPDHPGGIIGLSNLLLDYYDRKIELGQRIEDATKSNNPLVPRRTSTMGINNVNLPINRHRRKTTQDTWSENNHSNQHQSSSEGVGGNNDQQQDLKKTPENLNRLAARDRAYGLLSSLTKSGMGWDDSKAWFTLARAHEASISSSSTNTNINIINTNTGGSFIGGDGGNNNNNNENHGSNNTNIGGGVGGSGNTTTTTTTEEEKIKNILWWCIDLEDKRPIRHWRNLGPGVNGVASYVL